MLTSEEIARMTPEEKQARIKYLRAKLEANNREIRRQQREELLSIYNVGNRTHKKQVEFHKSAKRIKAIFGGNRTGKTVGGAAEAIFHASGDCRYRDLSPSSGWVVSLTGDVQKEVAQKEVLRWLPKRLVHEFIMRHGRKDDPENGLIDKILLKNGCDIGFKTCEQGRGSFQGPSKGWIWFDEEPEDKGIYDECRMRIMDTEGSIWFTMTPLKGLTWVYDLIYVNERNNPEIEYWMFEWDDNPYLTEEEKEQLVLEYGEEELKSRKYGQFTSACGFAFPELRKEIHIKSPETMIPDWYMRYVSIDYGFDSLAVVWYWMDNYGRARVYRALRKKGLIISKAAELILELTGNEQIHIFYGPPDLWKRQQDTGRSAAQIFSENGITLSKASSSREQGWLNVHEWLRPYTMRNEQTGEEYTTANLTFDEGLDPDLWKHLTIIQKAEKNRNDVALTPHERTHYPDAIRYFCVSRASAPREPREEKPVHQQHKERIMRAHGGANKNRRRRFMRG